MNRDDQFRPSVSIYGGHGLDGRSRDYVAAPGNNLEGVNKWCAQASDPLQAGQSGSPTAGPKAQGTSRMVNVWQHDEREVLPVTSDEKKPLSITRRRKR